LVIESIQSVLPSVTGPTPESTSVSTNNSMGSATR
jgi:hypothetical protein